MDIRIPRWAASAWKAFVYFSNKPVIWRVRRIDVLLAVAFVFCVSYYYWTAGWYTALIGALSFTMFAMIALWL
jgi:hypothetical protein